MFFYIFLSIVIISILWFVSGYNRLVRFKALLNEGLSGIDVQLKRRYDLIPNLVAVVKQYATHEKDTFEKVTELRTRSMNATTVSEKVAAEAGLTQALKTLFAVAENYPNLKANENFMSLQKDLSSIEHELQLARRYYNGTARNYNILVQTFPSNIIASFGGFKQSPYFELSSTQEREVPRVNFE